MGAQPDVDRQDPELAQQFEKAPLGGDGKGNQQQVDAHPACQIEQRLHRAELHAAGDGRWRAGIVAVVEDSDDRDVLPEISP